MWAVVVLVSGLHVQAQVVRVVRSASMKFIVKRAGMYYKNFTEGKPIWTSRPTLFEQDVAQKVCEQLVALGFAASVQSYDEFDRDRKARRS